MPEDSFCSLDILWNDCIDLRSVYIDRVLDDVNWLKSADDLIEAAVLIEPMVIAFWKSWNIHKRDRTSKVTTDKYIDSYFLLISFAIENFFKSILVKKKRAVYRSMLEKNGHLPNELRDHNLVSLAKKVDFRINSMTKEDILRRLTRYAIWAGRYPVPLTYKSLWTEKYNDGYEYLVTPRWETDITRIKELIKEIKDFTGL